MSTYSLVFNGSSAFVDFNGGGSTASFMDNPTNASIAFWVNAASGTGPIISKILDYNSNQGWFVEGAATTACYFQQVGAWVGNADGNIANGTWRNVIATKSGTTVTLYVDGASVGSTDSGGSFTTSTNGQNVFLGADNTGHYFTGKVCGLWMYTRVLTAPEIAGLVLGTTPVDATSLQGLYLFGEGSGSSLGDTSGGGHNGTITAATWSSDVPSVFSGPTNIQKASAIF
jgi:hypothetical protein